MAAGAAAPKPRPRFRDVALALAIGGIGGWLAHMAKLPLAWMIGAMGAITPLAVVGVPVALPSSLRSVMVAVLGVMLGSGFTPDIVHRMGEWGVSLAAMTLYLATAGTVCFWYYRRFCGYDRPTAYFSAMPGGLTVMSLVGSAMGGDTRIISLTHASRILLVVMVLPFAFQLLAGYQPGSRPPAGLPLLALRPVDLAVLAVCAVLGTLLARKLKLPAASLIGPMLLSAGVHLTGWTAAKPPLELVALAQIVVGTAIGCRFAGARASLILRVLVGAVGGTAVLMLASVGFALAVGEFSGLSPHGLILAYSPGGLAEMSLIAIAIGADSAFVATHHIVRVVLIMLSAPPVFRLLRRRQNRPG